MSKHLAAKIVLILVTFVSIAKADTKHLILVAGKPSHPPRMHEFNAGVQLLTKCLEQSTDIKVTFCLNGWPKDDSILDEADAEDNNEDDKDFDSQMEIPAFLRKNKQ